MASQHKFVSGREAGEPGADYGHACWTPVQIQK
jgi:hypothetical protein